MESSELAKVIDLACRCDGNVLITGPTGSGKSYLAQKIHQQGKRSLKPFISVNLATLHEGTLESELFGHERGAFTSADQKRVGRLESAQGGTVFLDEIGELSLKLQARLLDFLQSRTICPVGGNRQVSLDVRIIAATNRDLEGAVQKGLFREDLFHRLRLISIELKPLVDRLEDLDGIVHECLEELSKRAGRSVLRISEEVAQRLENYSWPGNFRELRNVLEYAVLAGTGPEIEAADLPPWFGRVRGSFGVALGQSGQAMLGVAEIPLSLSFYECMSNFEKEYLRRALCRYRFRVNHTARKIGINKTTLIRRMRFYGFGAAVSENM
ncbi:MAG: sigma-54 dependent transcriptional regulator [Bdellovibrionota bacterium]